MKQPHRPQPGDAQRGVTLVELLVALSLGLLVTIVALSMLVLGRSGYSAVDNTTQLADRERFVVDALSRVIMQAGFEDFGRTNPVTRNIAKADDPEPDLFGWNNAAYAQLSNLKISESTSIMACGASSTNTCVNGSDILVVRFQGAGSLAAPDGTMINCRGIAESGIIIDGALDERAANILYVARDSSTQEPSLYCGYYKQSTGAWVSGQPLIEGVESMQLLFGTDNVVPGAAPTFIPADSDRVVDRWLRADQLQVPGSATGTRENWRRVRAVRVGLVLRGPVGSAQERRSLDLLPLGAAYVSAADVGASFSAPADGRLRRVATFTMHIRNDLSTQ